MPAVPLESRFADLRQKGEKALVTFVTAGDPALDQLPAVLNTGWPTDRPDLDDWLGTLLDNAARV